MERLIDVKAFRQSLEVDRFGCTDIVKVNIALDKSTVDAVEVVRCKDCKHFPRGMAIGRCKRDPERFVPVPYNHFCSYGERKDNE